MYTDNLVYLESMSTEVFMIFFFLGLTIFTIGVFFGPFLLLRIVQSIRKTTNIIGR